MGETSGVHRRSTNRSHTPWIATLLAGSALLVALLVVNAAYTIRSHREATEAVLRDYASLAGDELLRRVAANLGYYGHREALGLLRRVASDPERSLEEHTAAGSDREQRSMELVRWAFQRLPGTHSLTPLGELRPAAIPAELAAWINAEAPPALVASTEGDFAVLQKAGRTFVVSPVDLEPEDAEQGSRIAPVPSAFIGFELDRDRLAPWAHHALDQRPLLPPSLGNGELGNELLFLRLSDASGEEFLRRGERYASALRVERRLPADYLQPLVGLTVHAAIDPAAAGQLVIGGLPRSRLPVLAGLTLLTSGLFVAAIVLLRRERALTRLRTDFVSRVSHELRTPLAQIRMFAETLRLGRVRNSEEAAAAIEIIDREARRLSALVENVLQLSRTERGVSSLAKERFPVLPFLETLIEEVTPLLPCDGNSPGVRVEIDVPADIEIDADADALRQSLLNLLDNAIKYGPPSQQVILGAEAGDNVTRIWVDDEGPGIDPAQRERVWQAFRRADNDGGVSGTGIGLSVVRELIEQHGGRCTVDSGSRGGARIVLELPAIKSGGEPS